MPYTHLYIIQHRYISNNSTPLLNLHTQLRRNNPDTSLLQLIRFQVNLIVIVHIYYTHTVTSKNTQIAYRFDGIEIAWVTQGRECLNTKPKTEGRTTTSKKKAAQRVANSCNEKEKKGKIKCEGGRHGCTQSYRERKMRSFWWGGCFMRFQPFQSRTPSIVCSGVIDVAQHLAFFSIWYSIPCMCILWVCVCACVYLRILYCSTRLWGSA